MGYQTSYKGKPRAEADEEAIQDIKSYVNDKAWEELLILVGEVRAGKGNIDQLNWCLGFIGISGYPFHAFCRKYLLPQYIEWRTSGEDGVKVDAEGFAESEGKG